MSPCAPGSAEPVLKNVSPKYCFCLLLLCNRLPHQLTPFKGGYVLPGVSLLARLLKEL